MARDVFHTCHNRLATHTPPTTPGTTVSSARTLPIVRICQTYQYDSPLNQATAAASPNDDSTGAATTAAAKNAMSRRSVSNRHGASLSRYRPPAAMSASEQLVRKSAPISGSGHRVGYWIRRCTGSTQASTRIQRRGGVSRSTDVSTALGGQSTDVVPPGRRS